MNERVSIRWWHAGGLHIHITHPDGSWERRIHKHNEWWHVDSVVAEMEARYGRRNVYVSP